MALLEGDFTQVPDVVVPIPGGTYTARIINAPQPEPTKDGLKQKIVLEMQIDMPENPEVHGKKLKDHIGLAAQTKIKRIFLSAGLPISTEGLNTDDLFDQIVTIRVKPRAYKDQETGETRQASGVDDYIITSA